jgi:serine/threonine protein kinase
MDTLPASEPMEKPPHSPLGGLDPANLLKQGAAEDTFMDGAATSFNPPPIEELAAIFPQFEILELIGKGGMGAVYKVRQRDLDRIVALKILPPNIGKSAEFSDRFTREAKALAKLNHPGIVTLHEFGQADGLYFILMEFMDGANLAQLMKTGRISPREALAIVPQICDALQFAHDQGVVHRDIKPENILLDRLGRVKVADFGIAKIVAPDSLLVVPPSGGSCAEDRLKAGLPTYTEAGKVLGTPQYMAPEQMDHPAEVDHRADIYALGVVFYQMLTGELPGKRFEAPSKKVHIDVRLDEIVLKAMEKDPELRFQKASVMRTRLENLEDEPINPAIEKAPPPSKKSSSTGKMIAIGCGVIALVVLLGSVMLAALFWAITPAQQSRKTTPSPRALLVEEQEKKTTSPAKPVQVFTLERSAPSGGVDLDTGKFVDYVPFGGFSDPAGAVLWREENGIDLVLNGKSRVPGVLVSGSQTPAADEWWEDVPEPYILEDALPKWEERPEFDSHMTFLPADGSQLETRTWVCRTPAGNIGILRLGPTHSVGGVRVEWRMVVERNPVNKTTGSTEAIAASHPLLMTEFGEFKSEQSLWSIRVSARDRTLRISRQPGSGGIGISISPSKWIARNGWFAFIEDEHYAWAYDGSGKLMLAEVTPEKSTLYETEMILRTVPDAIQPLISQSTLGKVGAKSGEPRLQYLAWQDEVEENPDWQAWRANGEFVKRNDMRLPPAIAMPAKMEVDESARSAVNPRFLNLWISHPAFDSLSVTEIKLLDEAGKPVEAPTHDFAIGVSPPSPQNHHLGWITAGICAGKMDDTPARVILNLNYSLGPWRYWNDIEADFRGTKAVSNGVLVTDPGQGADGKAFIQLTRDRTLDPNNEQFDFLAVTRDGGKLNRIGHVVSEVGQVNTERFVFDVPLEQVKIFRCRKRPIQMISWTVPLQTKLSDAGKTEIGGPEVAVLAEGWVAGIDAGNYGQSWKDAAKFFQSAITESAWVAALEGVRKPLGTVKSRKILAVNKANSLPGAPDGEYFLIQFDTAFAAKAEAVETVTFKLEEDGVWKAAGYFVR